MKRLGWAAMVVMAAALAARAQAPVVRAAAAAPEGAKAAPVKPTEHATELGDVARVKTLCLATRPPERVPFEGDEVARGAARDAYAKARGEAMKELYLARVPAGGFKLGEYRARDGRFALDLSRPLRTLHGALTLAVPSDADVAFETNEELAKAVSAAVRGGTATLDAYFEARDDQGAVCAGSAAADVFTVGAAPVLFELRDGMGTVLARAETPLADRHRSAVGGYSGAPAVVVGAVTVEGAGDAATIARKLQAGVGNPVKQCYAKRLESDPGAGGTVVLGIESGADGGVVSVSFIASALGDEGLQKCVEEAVHAVKFSGASLFRVPIELKLVTR